MAEPGIPVAVSVRRLAGCALLALLVPACVGGGAARDPDAPPSTIERTPSPTQEPSTVADPATSPPVTETPREPTVDDVRLATEVVAQGLESPVFVTPLSGTEDLLVLEQAGRVRRVAEIGEVSTWLDIRDLVGSGGNEQGLLGLALHPDFPQDERVWVHYTDRDGRTTLDVLRADQNGADPASRVNLLSVPQPAPNHNGGMLAFGHDRMLYLALGDGGAAGDRFGNAQDTSTLLGAILRLDVDGADTGYAIPDDNPFASGTDGAPEVWVYGLRNPWRFSFDGDRIYIGDVGQGSFEEISTVTVPEGGGTNFGWPITEGEACYRPAQGCDRTGIELPIVTYPTGESGACSVVQGPAYRGGVLPSALAGHVFYTDHCAGFLRSFRLGADGVAVEQRDWTGQVGAIEQATSFGVDPFGELLVTVRDGRVLRLVPAG